MNWSILFPIHFSKVPFMIHFVSLSTSTFFYGFDDWLLACSEKFNSFEIYSRENSNSRQLVIDTIRKFEISIENPKNEISRVSRNRTRDKSASADNLIHWAIDAIIASLLSFPISTSLKRDKILILLFNDISLESRYFLKNREITEFARKIGADYRAKQGENRDCCTPRHDYIVPKLIILLLLLVHRGTKVISKRWLTFLKLISSILCKCALPRPLEARRILRLAIGISQSFLVSQRNDRDGQCR